MTNDSALLGARALWEGLAAVPVSFPPAGGAVVVVSPASGLCPLGWVGLVSLRGAALATAPDERRAELVRRALAADPDAAGAPDRLAGLLPLTGVLGPAALAYLGPDELRPQGNDQVTVHQLPGDDPRLRDLEVRSGRQDRDEAGLADITSPAFAVLRGTRAVAACGYRAWPYRTAHFAVLTDPSYRGLGLAGLTATAATHHALATGLLPQWRARVPASRRVAARLGFRELGIQLSVQLP